MRYIFFSLLILHVTLLHGQSSLDDYRYFTPERRQVLSRMGEFFDATIRKNFPAETDTLSYLSFANCIAQSEGRFILEVDKIRLKEINRLLFKDHNYYFFYSRYIYLGTDPLPPREIRTPTAVDSIPTVRGFGVARMKADDSILPGFIFNPIINHEGFVKVVADDNPAVRQMKEDMALAGDVSLTMFLDNIAGLNLREVSQPVVKEMFAFLFWRYICICGSVDLVKRKSFCETCE